MRKKLLALALALIPMLVFSQHRSESEAITVAQEFWGNKVSRAKLMAVPQSSLVKAKARTMAKTASTTSGNKQSFYVINDEESNRFVIVSSDDRLVKILGYSDNGIFDAETAPEGLLEMMNEYDGQYTAMYNDLTSLSAPKQTTQYPIVEPLITSKWNQNAPYNNECPKNIKSYYGSNCVTGCVATAMAQIMNYWKYPECGNGSNTYTSSTQQIYQSMDFSTVHIDWNNILDVYNDDASDAQRSEVAKLNHAVGVSVSMDYGSTSWAYGEDAAYAFRHFWKYNPNIAYKSKYEYNNEEWKQLILDELTTGHPLWYRGSSGWAGGHAFILDGCNDDGLFHFNFGWAGNCDGYYALETISTYNGNYTTGQGMICYITPQEYGPKNRTFYSYSGLNLNSINVGGKDYLIQSVRYEEGIKTVNIDVTDKLTFYGKIGIGLFDKDFQFIKSLSQKEVEIENYSYGWISDWITFDAQTFSEGKQYYIACYVYSEEIGYTIVETNKHEEDFHLVKIQNGEITFEPMKLMGDQEPVVNEVVTGLYNVTAMNATGETENWQIQMWQDDSDLTKYWIANLDPKAKINGYGYNDGWNKVYGYINETGNKLSIPVGQTIGKNLMLHNYSGGDAIDVYLAASNKTMNIESAWGCQEVDYGSENATAKEFSRYEGGYFVYTTEKEDEPVDVDVSSPLISLSSAHILFLSCNSDGATLYYTLDGTQPSASSILYVAPVEIEGNCTIKAIATKDGKYSEVSFYVISDFICATPVISQSTGSNNITITSDTQNASIYYTLDNSNPTKSSTPYTGEFPISKSCIIKAIAYKADYKESAIATQSAIYYSPTPDVDYDVVVSGNIAGELSLRVPSDKFNATRWTISGEINGTDIAFIREAFDNGKITDLDLGNAIIVSGGEPYYKTSYSEYNTENNVVGTNMFYKTKSLISLVLPSTIQKIESYSIQDCDNLASITIPELCAEVESSGIYNCKNLSSIHIGQSLQKFESKNGHMCPALRNITVDTNNIDFVSVDGVLYSKNMDIIYKYPVAKTESSFETPSSVKVIEDYAFSRTSLESIKMPNGLESINTGAFEGCKDLLSVEIPQSVKEIGMFAFQNCAKITNVVVPDNVTELNSYAFGYCVNLRDINIGASVNEIEGSAFTGCTSLQSFIVNKDNDTYTSEGGILYSKDLTKLVRCPLALYSDEMILVDDILAIESNAFQNCKYIKKFRLPEGLKEIGSSAFDRCTMEAINVPNSVEKIDMFAFQNCTNLKNFAIPTSTSDVTSFILAYCDSLEYLYIHKDVTHIDSYAFTCAKKLNTIECWIEDISDLDMEKGYSSDYNSFKDIKDDCTWHVPAGCASAYKSQPWWVSTWKIYEDLVDGIANITNDTDMKVLPGEHSVDIVSSTDKIVNIHNLQGLLVNSVKVNAGQKTTVPLQSGVYLINKNKIRIK